MVRIIVILIAIISVSPALADYHYASHEGSNEYPYTSWATAADSIIKAVEAASAGDTVYVGAAIYYENVLVLDSIAVIGMGWDSTILQVSTDNYYGFKLNRDCLIEGFHI